MTPPTRAELEVRLVTTAERTARQLPAGQVSPKAALRVLAKVTAALDRHPSDELHRARTALTGAVVAHPSATAAEARRRLVVLTTDVRYGVPAGR